jgi:hypothetical protein
MGNSFWHQGQESMPNTFFTYVWGSPGNPAWPLTFATKAARNHAKANLAEGDLVFTVGTKGEPTPREERGRVLGVFRASDLEVNTQDYDLPRNPNPKFDGVLRFPYALHPRKVWEIEKEDAYFSHLVGPLTPRHHLQAQSQLVELDAEIAKPLIELSRREVAPLEPSTGLGRGLVARKKSKLAPKHEGSFSGSFKDHGVWYVYILSLEDQRRRTLAVKVGYSSDPQARVNAMNSPMAVEVTGLRWRLHGDLPTDTEDVARTVEQALLMNHRQKRLESNGEVLAGVDPTLLIAEAGNVLRDLKSSGS